LSHLTRPCQKLKLFGLSDMALFLLDSNACIDAMRDPTGPVAGQMAVYKKQSHVIVTSTIVQFELELGVRMSARPQAGANRLEQFFVDGVDVLEFDGEAAKAAAVLFRTVQLRSRTLQAYDLLIAGHAIAIGATLVTGDARLAEAVTEVEVVNWR
jgi:tRNA(fMet)-specific endonuclease VapC